jgi:hypothetical protein
VWFGVVPVPLVESPKSQAYPDRVPSASLEADPSKATARFVAVELKSASGAWLGGGAVTVTACVTELVSPVLSVTVRVTSYVPPAA